MTKPVPQSTEEFRMLRKKYGHFIPAHEMDKWYSEHADKSRARVHIKERGYFLNDEKTTYVYNDEYRKKVLSDAKERFEKHKENKKKKHERVGRPDRLMRNSSFLNPINCANEFLKKHNKHIEVYETPKGKEYKLFHNDCFVRYLTYIEAIKMSNLSEMSNP